MSDRTVGIHPIYRSGFVERWHTSPDVPAQTLADHHGRTAQIVLFFWPDAEPDLVYAALHHDCGELYVGDMPAPAKQAAQDFQLRMIELEANARESIGIKPLKGEGYRLHFADKVEAYTYVAQKAPHILGQPQWVDALHALGVMADDLRVSQRLADWFRA